MMLTKQQMQDMAGVLRLAANDHLAANLTEWVQCCNNLLNKCLSSEMAVRRVAHVSGNAARILNLLDNWSSFEYLPLEERQAIRFMMMHFIALFLSTEEGPIDDEQLNFF